MNSLSKPSALPIVLRPITHCLALADANVAADGNAEHDTELSTVDAADVAEYATPTPKNWTNV